MQDLAVPEKPNVSRAQHIAQEKLKLIEKEKQIAEKLRKLKQAQVDKDAARSTAANNVSGVSKSVEPKWKSQDVIRIDRDAQPDVSVKQRRKSLLDMNQSTTPNIPLTPHRPSSSSAAETETISEARVKVKQTDPDEFADLSTAFKMPSGTQLANFCTLQVRLLVCFSVFFIYNDLSVFLYFLLLNITSCAFLFLLFFLVFLVYIICCFFGVLLCQVFLCA